MRQSSRTIFFVYDVFFKRYPEKTVPERATVDVIKSPRASAEEAIRRTNEEEIDTLKKIGLTATLCHFSDRVIYRVPSTL